MDCELKPPYCPVVEVPTSIAGTGGENVSAELGQSGAVDFGEFYLQQNFLSADGAEGEDIDDVFRVGGGELSGALGNVFGGDMAGENDGSAGGSDADLFVGEDAMFFFGAGADIDIDAEIEATGTLQFIPDEK